MFCALCQFDVMFGTGPPDNITCPPSYVLTAATFRACYMGIFEIDNQAIAPPCGRYWPWSGPLYPADNDSVVVQNDIDVRRCHTDRLPFLHGGLGAEIATRPAIPAFRFCVIA